MRLRNLLCTILLCTFAHTHTEWNTCTTFIVMVSYYLPFYWSTYFSNNNETPFEICYFRIKYKYLFHWIDKLIFTPVITWIQYFHSHMRFDKNNNKSASKWRGCILCVCVCASEWGNNVPSFTEMKKEGEGRNWWFLTMERSPHMCIQQVFVFT